MQLYRGSAATFAKDIAAGTLGQQLIQAFANRLLHRPSSSEVGSWLGSLPAVAKELLSAGLEHIEVLLEYSLPLTSKRVDVLLLGTHPATGTVSAIVWENKQWTYGEIEDVDGCIVKVGKRLLLHPQQQVHQYVEYLNDFNQQAHEGHLEVYGLAFLHNATRGELARFQSAALAYLARYPMFSGDDSGALRAFLTERICGKEAGRAADEFLNARIRPAKQLLDHLQQQIEGHDAFTLLDQQMVAYEVVRKAVDESRKSDLKKVVIVKGGPGSGKSVIATSVLGYLAKRGYNVSHATGSRSFTTTLRNRVGPRAANLFRYFNNFAQAEPNDLDVLIADEAHRVRETSNSRYTARSNRSNVAQVEELIRAARVPLFLLDEQQVVRPGEIGTVAVIRDAAIRNRAEVIEIDLDSHFRCGGSEAYLVWVQRLLGLAPGGPIVWTEDGKFQIRLCSSPQELENWTNLKHQEGYSARLAAGFCWPWSDPQDGRLVEDVVVGDWKRPWNLKPEKRIKGVPSASLWASDPRGVDQVGCIYTAQGFEYDYSGVILGPDLVSRSGTWVTDRTASHDTIVKQADNFDELIRHTYRVLLTRGLRGCAVYSTDEETSRFLATLGLAGQN